jgi:hypothetical protein
MECGFFLVDALLNGREGGTQTRLTYDKESSFIVTPYGVVHRD